MAASTDSTPRPPTDRRARLRRRLRRAVLTRRRPLAALCVALAVVAGLHAVRPPDPPTVRGTVAAHDLASRTGLSRRDPVVRRLPAALSPGGATADAPGRPPAAPGGARAPGAA